jgi:hypothetical protein
VAVFTLAAWISLGIAFFCALVIVIDEIRHPQKMWIMNIVWPVTALYLSVFGLWGYFRIGSGMTKNALHGMSKDQMQRHKETSGGQASRDPTWQQTAVSDTHCGAGCVIGDIIAFDCSHRISKVAGSCVRSPPGPEFLSARCSAGWRSTESPDWRHWLESRAQTAASVVRYRPGSGT